ncbi:hypothetical protein O6R08_03855 [Cutibacterium equinum]|uniref:Uncharacterized protein n=1 Tax=Cutibacterium equinum TaxID=3016342 RepID=A0ABY7R007_9ACTN|nr:hypothetical protein [Cutibacterium equinum]WCC80634.1 hypothetical protein O6R08_03855 [Cutibacterium equinum]
MSVRVVGAEVVDGVGHGGTSQGVSDLRDESPSFLRCGGEGVRVEAPLYESVLGALLGCQCVARVGGVQFGHGLDVAAGHGAHGNAL